VPNWPGGRLVCAGLPADDKMTIPAFGTVLGGKSIIGSTAGGLSFRWLDERRLRWTC
jgi:D-arabinose 1-dehydrogenase-like Zn-dependent alcohol dehydrogenase